MMFFKPSRRVLHIVLCTLLFGCGPDKNDNEKIPKSSDAPNIYTNSGMAGWLWQGTGGDVETETQIWQLTFPLLLPNWSSASRFYPPPFPDQPNWDIKTTGDFNGDGSADILWRHRANGAWRVWQMHHGLRVGQNRLPDFDAAFAWRVVASGDTDKDGDDDVILSNDQTGEVMIWQMHNYANIAANTVGTRAGYVVNRIGDFNRDGDVDLMFRQVGTDTLSIWEIEANSLVQERKFSHTGSGWQPVCAADIDNDGDDDIMLVSKTDNQDKWFVIENYARVRQQAGASNVGYKFLGCGDYDADGDADTLWQNNSDGRIRVMLQQDYGTRKQAVYMNPFGGTDPSSVGYGFEYRSNNR